MRDKVAVRRTLVPDICAQNNAVDNRKDEETKRESVRVKIQPNITDFMSSRELYNMKPAVKKTPNNQRAAVTLSAAIDPSLYKISVEERTQSGLFCDGIGQSKRTERSTAKQGGNAQTKWVGEI